MPGVRALDGVRVFELSIAVAAPSCARYLAHHGAEVLKVESRSAPDVARLFGSAWARTPELAGVFTDTSPYLPEMSAGKRSVGLDLKRPRAMEVAKRLIASCDVFLTNYSTPAVRGLGLGYDEVRAIREDIIYIAMPGFGSDESLPYYEYLAWGPNQAPLVGLDALTGHIGEEPAGIASIAPPDYIAGLHATMGLLAALDHRDDTGEGTYVDLAQFETTVSLLGPYLFDHQLSGTVQGAIGNRSPHEAPSGVYPTCRHEEWVAITVGDDAAWSALLGVVADEGAGEGGGAAHPLSAGRYATEAGRREHHDALDEALAAWTGRHSAEEVAGWLQAAGVAAYPVSDHAGVARDPQVRDREWFMARPCHRFPVDLFSGNAMRLVDTPGDVDRAGPSMGEDTVAVLREVVGLTDEEIAEVMADGAFTETEPERVLRRPYQDWLPILGIGVERPARREGDE